MKFKDYFFVAFDHDFNLVSCTYVNAPCDKLTWVIAGFQLAFNPTETYFEYYEVTEHGNKLVETNVSIEARAKQVINLANVDSRFSADVEVAVEKQLSRMYGVDNWCDLADKINDEMLTADENGFYQATDESEQKIEDCIFDAIVRYYEENPEEDLWMKFWN
jgi:hypothetical protein